MRNRLAALAILAWSSGAQAAEVIDKLFRVEVTRNGETAISEQRTVPLLPDEACYYWYLQFAPGTTGEVSFVERLVLPAPALSWDPEDDDDTSQIVVDPDGKGVTTTFSETPDIDGWVSRGWCVAKGDPLGPHSIRVEADGVAAGSWDFDVVAPEADGPGGKPAPKVPDVPTARS